MLTVVNREIEAEVSSDPAFRERPYAFASMCYVVLDLEHGTLTYAIAGNEPPVLISGADGSLESLSRVGMVLNVDPTTEYEEETRPLHPGDTVVMFTDGLTEIRNPYDQFLGREGLLRIIEDQAGAPNVGALVENVFRVVNAFGQRASHRDDMTLLAARVTATDLGEAAAWKGPVGVD